MPVRGPSWKLADARLDTLTSQMRHARPREGEFVRTHGVARGTLGAAESRPRSQARGGERSRTPVVPNQSEITSLKAKFGEADRRGPRSRISARRLKAHIRDATRGRAAARCLLQSFAPDGARRLEDLCVGGFKRGRSERRAPFLVWRMPWAACEDAHRLSSLFFFSGKGNERAPFVR